MPATLRRRLQCHYCSRRLNTVHRTGSKIKCESCLADNYFDANNNLIDVPTEEVQGSAGQTVGLEVVSNSTIFCKTCLKNQQLYVQALSEYLPDPEDARYHELENSLPAYKKNLELRYPQCCPQCEPRVQASLRQANYAAKADHLRRMLHKRSSGTRRSRLHYKRLLVSLAGIGQVLSLTLQIGWHALSSQLSPTDVSPSITLRQCFQRFSWPAQCSEHLALLLPISFLIGLLCIWWNPKWQHKLAGQDGRLQGLNRYYQLQIVLLALRLASWILLRDLPEIKKHGQAIHSFSAVLFGLASVYSWTAIVRFDTTPLVDWNQPQVPLVDPNQFMQPLPKEGEPSTFSSPSPFTVDSLSGSRRPQYNVWQPPTPPADSEHMDWESTAVRPVLNPRPRTLKQKFTQQSPFFGNLPAQPVRGSLHPNAPPPPPARQALGIPPGFFGLSKSAKTVKSGHDNVGERKQSFRPAKFFGHDQNTDTGLENLFDSFFSVKDNTTPINTSEVATLAEPPYLASSGSSQNMIDTPHSSPSRHAQPLQTPIISMVISCTIIVALSIVATSLCSLEYLFGETTEAPSTMLGYTATIPLLHSIEEVFTVGSVYSLSSGMIVQAISITASYLLIPQNGSQYVPIWNKLVIGVIFLLIMQEIYRFCQLQSPALTRNSSAVGVSGSPRVATSQRSTIPPGVRTEYESTSPNLHYAPPTQAQPSNPFLRSGSSLKNRNSNESMNSSISTQTRQTGTTVDWNTPYTDHRSSDWHPDYNKYRNGSGSKVSSGFGGLNLGGNSGILGSRTRPK